MQNTSHQRERFIKPFGFLRSSQSELPVALQQVFQNFEPEEFRNGLARWQRLALASHECAYDEPGAREDLMELTEALQKLVECWYIISTTRSSLKNKLVDKRQKKLMKQDDFVYTLTWEQQAKPTLYLQMFCTTFTPCCKYPIS